MGKEEKALAQECVWVLVGEHAREKQRKRERVVINYVLKIMVSIHNRKRLMARANINDVNCILIWQVFRLIKELRL